MPAARIQIPRDDAPLIVTALLDERAFAILDGLRRRHFPAALNKIPAHVSLFHALPGAEIETIGATLDELAARTACFDLWPLAPVSLGRGVAFRYESNALSRLHGELARGWAAWLSPQDRQTFKAHVTIQNKVAPADARALLRSLDPDAIPACRIEGLSLWRYRGGPWETVATSRFAGA